MRLDPILEEHLRSPILDIGCGKGDLVIELRSRMYLVTGVDKVRQWEPYCDFIESDVTDDTGFFAWNDFFYSCIIMWDVLEHIKRSAVLTLLKRCHSTLSHDGTLILHLPNAEGLFGSRILHSDLTHRWAYTPQLITALLHKAGFQEVSIYECRPIVHGPVSFLRYCAWVAISVIGRVALAVETGTIWGIMSQNMLVVARKSCAV